MARYKFNSSGLNSSEVSVDQSPINNQRGGGVEFFLFSGKEGLRSEEKEEEETDDAIGDAGKGVGSVYETLSLKSGRSCGRAGKTRKKE